VLADSYPAMPIGAPIADMQAFVSSVPLFFNTVLKAGVLLALPVAIALLAVNLAFGVLARAAAQLNPMALGLPVALLTGLVLMAVLARGLQGPVQALFEQAFAAARALTG
jgi:flagellar biosynthetic protein FliR